jgi:hypothetical protein
MKKLIVLMSLALPMTVTGQSNSAAALKGIQSVQVIIDVAQFEDALRAPMELELRRTGLHVSTDSSSEKVDAVVTLHLQYELPSSGQYSPVFARLSIERRTYLLPRPNSASIIAIVWETNFITSTRSDLIESATRQALDRFLNQWLEVNPKRGN